MKRVCGVALAAAFLATGIEANRLVLNRPQGSRETQIPRQGRAGPAGGVTWDFETGNLLGWQPSGRAFVSQPTFGDNPLARQREPANQQGQYWIGTYENYQGPGRGQPGGIQGDGPQGALTSIPFTIPPSLTFRIGGGSTFETRVELLVFNQIEGESRAMAASGKDSETMQVTSWDLTQWAGRTGRLRIVDAASGPWGHINVDDFRFGLPRRGLDVLKIPGGERGGLVVQPVPASVPDLSGRTEGEARDLLAKARLSVGEITKVQADITPGTVLKQDRTPGSSVAIGTPVGFALAIPITVTVPDLSGRTEREARDLLAKARLSVGEITKVQADITPGTVLKQDRTPGSSVAIGTRVGFALAVPITVEVPQLVDRTQSEAIGLIKGTRLAPGAVKGEESRRPVDTVLRQEPPAGRRVEIGTAVNIVTATPVTVAMPNLVGRPHEEAMSLLKDLELVAGDVGSEEARRPPGSVLRQSVAPGTRVTIGSAVNLVTATPVTVLVPGLVGQSEDKARQRLADIELVAGTIDYQESPAERGTVLTQSIDPDNRVALGTAVNLVVAATETVAVPSFVGLTVDQARRSVLESRLVVGSEQQRGTNVEPPGTVLAQSNVPGSRVAVGTPIVLTVAMPLIVIVPPVVGLKHDAAAAAITAAGLQVGNVSRQFSLQAGGTVLAQATPPGAQVQFGAAVALDEARPRALWLVPGAGLLILAIAGVVRGGLRRRKLSHLEREERFERTPPLDFAVRSRVDAGDAIAQSDEAPAIRRDVRLQPVADGGSQELSAAAGDLVRGERRERKQGAPPPEEKP